MAISEGNLVHDDNMEERDIVAGARVMKKPAATDICYQNFSSHISEQLINHISEQCSLCRPIQLIFCGSH